VDLDPDLDFDVDPDEVSAQVSEALGLNGAPLTWIIHEEDYVMSSTVRH
jgi:hypothetical protein